MTAREAIHRLVDDLPEKELSVARRVLEALSESASPMMRALLEAESDDEPDDDDFDGGLTEARQEARDGGLLTHEQLERRLGLS